MARKFINRSSNRELKHRQIRQKIQGSKEVPRVCVFKSLTAFYVQAVDDEAAHTLASTSTRRESLKNTVTEITKLGEIFAQKLRKIGIARIVFDRGGYVFHGKIAAFARSLREGGIKF